jgi:hypothetical protein
LLVTGEDGVRAAIVRAGRSGTELAVQYREDSGGSERGGTVGCVRGLGQNLIRRRAIVFADRGLVRGLVHADDLYELVLQALEIIGGVGHGHRRGVILRSVVAPTVHVSVMRRLQRVACLTDK